LPSSRCTAEGLRVADDSIISPWFRHRDAVTIMIGDKLADMVCQRTAFAA
jgi:hypothetical protein